MNGIYKTIENHKDLFKAGYQERFYRENVF